MNKDCPGVHIRDAFIGFKLLKGAPEQHIMLKQEPPNKRCRPAASSCSNQLFHLLEKDVVFEMDMLMQIGLKSFQILVEDPVGCTGIGRRDRKSTRLNSSHVAISYAVFCLKKIKKLL